MQTAAVAEAKHRGMQKAAEAKAKRASIQTAASAVGNREQLSRPAAKMREEDEEARRVLEAAQKHVEWIAEVDRLVGEAIVNAGNDDNALSAEVENTIAKHTASKANRLLGERWQWWYRKAYAAEAARDEAQTKPLTTQTTQTKLSSAWSALCKQLSSARLAAVMTIGCTEARSLPTFHGVCT